MQGKPVRGRAQQREARLARLERIVPTQAALAREAGDMRRARAEVARTAKRAAAKADRLRKRAAAEAERATAKRRADLEAIIAEAARALCIVPPADRLVFRFKGSAYLAEIDCVDERINVYDYYTARLVAQTKRGSATEVAAWLLRPGWEDRCHWSPWIAADKASRALLKVANMRCGSS